MELSRLPKGSTSLILKAHPPNSNLKDLQTKYVITPNDKATTNVAFICQRFCAQVLVKEPGLQNSDASNIIVVFLNQTLFLRTNLA